MKSTKSNSNKRQKADSESSKAENAHKCVSVPWRWRAIGHSSTNSSEAEVFTADPPKQK